MFTSQINLFNHINTGLKHRQEKVFFHQLKRSVKCEQIFKILIQYNIIRGVTFYDSHLKGYWVFFDFFNKIPNFKLLFKPSLKKTITYKSLKHVFYFKSKTFYILSTSKGIMCSNLALKNKIGGLLLYEVNF